MKKLNQEATKVFMTLIEKMGSEDHRKFTSVGFMDLTVERIGWNVSTLYGSATDYSVAHYYEQEGDLMRDPEMCFLVVDNRQEPDQWEMVGVYAYYFLQDAIGKEETSIVIKDKRTSHIYPKMQTDHTRFANGWMGNIEDQGFLK